MKTPLSITNACHTSSIVAIASGLLFGPLLSATMGQATPFNPDQPNFAKDATVTAEGTTAAPGVSAKNLTDSNALTFWKGTVPSVITLDLGEVKDISSLDLYIPPQYATPRKQEIEVKTSPDGSTYTVASAKELQVFGPQGKNMLSIPLAAKARYVRVTITSNDQDGGEALLSEISIPH